VTYEGPMAPSTEWKETIAVDEAARFEGYAQTLRSFQRTRSPVGRALHAKSHLGVEAQFTVLPDLPEHARVGLFAKAATYPAYVRFSNGSGSRQSDHKGDVRGLALKVVGVAGKKLIPGMENAVTQDFLAILNSTTPFRDADEFVWFVAAANKPALLLPKVFGRFGLVGGFRLLRSLLRSAGKPLTSVATANYYSALPVKFGPYAVHYRFAPHSQDNGAPRGKSPDYVGEELAARLAQGPVEYDFKVQFFCDEARTPIEDASVEWKEADAPWVTVGRLTLPQQVVGSARGQKLATLVEGMSFDPWHALEEHRPLGDLMRARNAAYRVSTQERKASPEPDGSEKLD
jgi:hypothetical protein